MEEIDLTYNNRLRSELVGKTLSPTALPNSYRTKPMFSFWGEDAGIPPGDIHASRAYRIYLTFDSDYVIQNATVMIEGELISPCSGYHLEVLDEFDCDAVIRHCLSLITGKSVETPTHKGGETDAVF